MDKLFGNKKAFLLFLLPGIILFSFILFVPLVQVIYYSFCNYDLIGSAKWTGMTNYKELLTNDKTFMVALKNAVFFMIFSVVTQQVLGLIIAAVLNNLKKGKNFFKNIYYLPSVLSSAALGLLWMFIFTPKFGVNVLLSKIGIEGPLWLADNGAFICLPMWVIGFVALWQYVGQNMMLYMAQMTSIPTSIYEAASIDGASKVKTFIHITLPLLKPMFVTTVSLNCIGSLKFFDLIYSMTKGGPNNKTQVLATYLYQQGFEYNKFGYASAISVILLVICLVLAFVLNVCVKVDNYEM